MDSPHKGTITWTFSLLSLWTNCWTNTRLAGNSRHHDGHLMYWIVSMEGAGGLTPIWRQDTLNRHSKIGQLHIYHHANFCKVVQSYQLLCERQQCSPMLETYGICKTMCFARAIRWLYYLIICPMLNSMPLPRVLYQSGKNTSRNEHYGRNIVTFYIWDYFTLFFIFVWLHVCMCACL